MWLKNVLSSAIIEYINHLLFKAQHPETMKVSLFIPLGYMNVVVWHHTQPLIPLAHHITSSNRLWKGIAENQTESLRSCRRWNRKILQIYLTMWSRGHKRYGSRGRSQRKERRRRSCQRKVSVGVWEGNPRWVPLLLARAVGAHWDIRQQVMMDPLPIALSSCPRSKPVGSSATLSNIALQLHSPIEPPTCRTSSRQSTTEPPFQPEFELTLKLHLPPHLQAPKLQESGSATQHISPPIYTNSLFRRPNL